MNNFYFPEKVVLTTSRCKDAVYLYAVSELKRLLLKLNISTQEHKVADHGKKPFIYIDAKNPENIRKSDCKGVVYDGYEIEVKTDVIAISACSFKGVLNAVYRLAEMLGFLFLYPGEDGEWIPERARGQIKIQTGKVVDNPRFPYRGVFAHGLPADEKEKYEWMRFFAKLRFNAIGTDLSVLPLAMQLGMRFETGGHGLTALLPRGLFDKEPELFRMSQPEDFSGTRQNDYNCCITNPKTRSIIQANYLKMIKKLSGVYAFHSWPDDLPGGGWCFCPRCRALSPSDQAMLSMNVLSDVIRREGLSMRVPMLVYHDTIMPGDIISPSKETFLLYAPRERCYAHSLDNPECPRNRFYLEGLKRWTEKFRNIGDAHTFEYYLDQILFRGLYPFIPDVILRDMKVYETYGIESHMTLQVGGVSPAPDYNLLIFARGLWDKELTSRVFISELSGKILSSKRNTWQRFLGSLADIFQSAMRLCEYSPDIYLDYRWLPETRGEFGRFMVSTYYNESVSLKRTADSLLKETAGCRSDRIRKLAHKNGRIASFEAAELEVMSAQQSAVNSLAEYYNKDSPDILKKSLKGFKKAMMLLKKTRISAQKAEIPGSHYYYACNKWLEKEFAEKVRIFSKVRKADKNKKETHDKRR